MRLRCWTALLLLPLILQLLSLLTVSLGIHEYEERYNAAHAVIAQSGWSWDLLGLQYQPFCGGCSVNALLGSSLFTLWGSHSIAVWRGVGWLWFALAMLAASRAAWRAGQARAARAVLLCFALAPPAYQELALVGWGNHLEGGALLMLILALGVEGIHQEPRRAQLCWVLQGLLVGLGLFMTRSLLLALPVWLLTGLLLRGGGGLRSLGLLGSLGAMALGLSLMLPIRETFGTWPLAMVSDGSEALGGWSASWESLLSITLPVQWQGIWGDVSAGAWAWAGVPAGGVWLLLLGWGRPLGWRPLSRDQVLLWAGLLGFLTMYLLTPYRVWMNQESAPMPQQVRYLALIWPLVFCLAGLGWARLSTRSALLCGLILGAVSLSARARTAVEGEPQLTLRRVAPDWCFQRERLRGPGSLLERASEAAGSDLLAFARGARSTREAYFVEFLPPDQLRLGPSAGMDLNSWRQGRAYGVLDEDIRAEQRDWWARARHLEQTLGDEPESWTPALKSSWCHSRDSLLEAGYQTIPDDLRAADSLGFLLGSMAQGAVSARSCARGGSDEDGSSTLAIQLDSSCPAWLNPVEPWSYGWGMGASLGELHGGQLTRLTLGADPADAELLRQGLLAGYRWGRALSWSGSLPTLIVTSSP